MGELDHEKSIKLLCDLFLVRLSYPVFGEVFVMAKDAGIMSIIRTPLGIVILFIIMMVLAGLGFVLKILDNIKVDLSMQSCAA